MKSKSSAKKRIPVSPALKNELPPVVIVTPAEKKALKELLFEQKEKGKRAAELVIANKELVFQNKEKKNRAAELVIAGKELVYEKKEKGKRAAELIIANKELLFQNKEKEKKAADLVIANKELVFQNREKENRAAELIIANTELAFQNKEKENRARELVVANNELLFQNQEKEKRAAELVIANIELKSQNTFKEDLQAELISANIELVYQNKEREKREAELLIANNALAFENKEKEKRAAELVIANKELTFQNKAKEKLSSELMIANIELVYRTKEKEARATELAIANEELAFQNSEKEKRAAELIFANTELIAFNYISSHDLQEPLRKIQTFSGLILDLEDSNLSEKGHDYFRRIRVAAARMQQLIEDLLLYSRTNVTDRQFKPTDLAAIIEDVKADLKEAIENSHAVVEIGSMCPVNIIPFQFRQLMNNLIGNSLKFADPARPMRIHIKSNVSKGMVTQDIFPGVEYCHIEFSDNGIGFDPVYKDRIFEVFQKLHGKNEYKGTGIGLAIVKKIIENHNGIIKATGEIGKGTQFDIYIPVA